MRKIHDRKLVTKILSQIFIVALLSLGVAGLAQATTATWNFDVPLGDVGSATHTYFDSTSGSNIPLTAYGSTTATGPTTTTLGSTWGPTPPGGFTNDTGAISAHNLFGKSSGFGETGLGLTGLPSNEIQFTSFIQLDLAAAKSAGATDLHMGIGSMQAGEGYLLWGSNTLGTPGTLLKTSLGLPVVQDFDGPSFAAYRYFSISATAGSPSDVLLLNGLTSTIVPLNPSVLLLGTGLLGLIGLGWRRRKTKV
jgi:hypothetical protein